MFYVYKPEDRVERMVGRLISRNEGLEARLAEDASTREQLRADFDATMERQHARIAELTAEIAALQHRVSELHDIACRRETRIFELDAERKSIRRLFTWPLLRVEKMIRGP